MRILILGNRIPYPPKDGGAIAVLNMVYGFIRQDHKVKFLSLNTNKHYVKIDSLPVGLKESAQLEAVDINTDIKAFAAFTNLVFSKESYNIVRFYSKDFEKKLSEVLKKDEYDIIQIEGLHMSTYLPVIRAHSKAIVSLRAHNVEHIIWERLAMSESKGPKRTYLKILARRMKKFELHVMNEYDSIIAITEEDETIFKNNGCTVPIHVSPTGLSVKDYKIDKRNFEKGSFFHLGALDWMPNQQAIQWFLEDIWPVVVEKYPDAKFYMAGRSPEWISNLKIKGVEIVGEVPSAADFINSKEIMVVPLLSGSGMRIKIIEGMALGKCIISTSVGAEGIDYTNGENILIADSAKDFSDAIEMCINDPQLASQLGKNARLLAEREYDNDKITKELTVFYSKLLKAHH